MAPREPTDDEVEQLGNAYREETGLVREEFPNPNPDSVAVFESYTTGSPGYSGKAAVFLTEVGASVTFGWRDGEAFVMHFPTI